MAGATDYDNGVNNDMVEILGAHGINHVRPRMIVNPSSPGGCLPRPHLGHPDWFMTFAREALLKAGARLADFTRTARDAVRSALGAESTHQKDDEAN